MTTRIFAVYSWVMAGTQVVQTEAIDATATQGKVVIVTGAARGQGAREAELFASPGAATVLFLASPAAKYITGGGGVSA